MTFSVRAASLREALRQPGNDRCADCRAPLPTWASYNIGVFLCQDCAGIHRSLGAHISKVRSVTLDLWDQGAIDMMFSSGNIRVNSAMEALLKKHDRISHDATSTARAAFIRAKYIDKKFIQLVSPCVSSQPVDLFAGLNVWPSTKTSSTVRNQQECALLTSGYSIEFNHDTEKTSNMPNPQPDNNKFAIYPSNSTNENLKSVSDYAVQTDNALLPYGVFDFS